MEKRVPPSSPHEGHLGIPHESTLQRHHGRAAEASPHSTTDDVFGDDVGEAVLLQMSLRSPGEVVQVWQDDHHNMAVPPVSGWEGIGHVSVGSTLRSEKQDESFRSNKPPVSVYMACVSLDSCKVSKGCSHVEAPCCCKTCDRSVGLAPSPSCSHTRKHGSAKNVKSHRSYSEPSSSYTLVVKPKALRPFVNGSVVHYPASFNSLQSPGMAQKGAEFPLRPGSTPSQPVTANEEDASSLHLPYSSPNSPVPFALTVNNNRPQSEKMISLNDKRKDGSSFLCVDCAACRWCQSAGVESGWKMKTEITRAEKTARRRSEADGIVRQKKGSVNTRCLSEVLGKRERSPMEKARVPRGGGQSPNSKQSLRYVLGSCLGSWSSANKKEDVVLRQKRRFLSSLPSALVNLFHKGCPPPLRSTSGQAVPCPELVGGDSGVGSPCRSPYLVRALPPLPNEANTPCELPMAADDVIGPSGDSDRKSMDYAASIEKVKDCGWYWGPVSGETAECLLANEPDGSFIVRDSSDEHYIFSLTFKLNGLVRHVRIEHDQGNFSFGCLQKFHSSTIVDFIENAVEHSRSGRYLFFLHRRPILGPMRVQLLHPVSRFKQVQSLQHLCRFSILKTIRRDLINSLPLPVCLKAYLNTPHYYSEELAKLSRKGQTIPDLSSQPLPAAVGEPSADATLPGER